MFRIDDSPQFDWPVEYSFATADGKRITQTFTGIFKRVNEEYIDEALAGKKADGSNVERIKSVDEVVKEVLVGFKDVQNADGSVMESSAKNIAKLLSLAGMNTAIFKAFFEASAQVKAKN